MQQDDGAQWKGVTFTKWARRQIMAQSLFLDYVYFQTYGSWSMSCRMLFMDDWSCWEKQMDFYFWDHGKSDQSLFLDWQSKIEKSNIIVS